MILKAFGVHSSGHVFETISEKTFISWQNGEKRERENVLPFLSKTLQELAEKFPKNQVLFPEWKGIFFS